MQVRSNVLLVITLLSLLPVSNSSAAQSTKQDSKKKPPKVITLTGCVQADEKNPGQFLITDAAEGTYRIIGKDFREFLGRPVTLDGGVVVKGVVVKGGLGPTANIAAQAGAIDPSRAAVQAQVAQSTTGREDDAMPQFRVKTVKTAPGQCK